MGIRLPPLAIKNYIWSYVFSYLYTFSRRPLTILSVSFVAIIPLEKLTEWGGDQMALYLGKDFGDLLIVNCHKYACPQSTRVPCWSADIAFFPVLWRRR
jgi:hypothetical protein